MENAGLSAITTDYLKRTIIESGATLAGFGDVSAGLAPELRQLNNAISIALRHFTTEIIKAPRVIAYSNQLEAVDNRLEGIQKAVVYILRSYGYKCLAIPPDTLKADRRFISKLFPLFPHKTAATCSGLGWIGKNGLLINEQFGPRLSWATVLTNAPLKLAKKPYTYSRCENCNVCVKICPAGAVSDRLWIRGITEPGVDYDRCSEHLERNRKILGKAVCGLCIIVCPKGRDNC